MMRTVFYAIVGDEGIVCAEINMVQLIGELKQVIKEQAMYTIPADRLTLYLAKQNGDKQGAWMTTADKDFDPLMRGDASVARTYLVPELLLDPSWSIEDHLGDAPKDKVVHVLVVHPQIMAALGLDHQATRASTTDERSLVDWLAAPVAWASAFFSHLQDENSPESKKKV